MAFLGDVTINANGTAIVDLDTLASAQIHMEMGLRAGLFYIPLAFWMDMDFTNPEDPVYIIIVEVPEMVLALAGLGDDPTFARPYWVIDYAALFAETPELMGLMAGSMDLSFGLDSVMDLLPEMEALGDNQYRMTVNDEWLVEIMVFSVETMINTLFADPAMMLSLGAPIPADILEDEAELALLVAELQEEVMEELGAVLQVLENVTIFSQDWVTYYVLNEDGYPVQEESSFQLIFDLAEWANAIATVDPTISAIPLPEVVVTVDVEYTVVYENINAAQPVTFPDLTPENSVDVFELLMGF
jgi:hypothetical protein